MKRLSLLLGLVLPAVPARSQVVPVMGSEETGFGPVSEYAMLGWEVTEDGQVLVTRTRPTMIRVADWREAPVLPDGTLLDVASTVPGEPAVIYYNPLLLGRYQPDLQAFFLAYERAHVALGHRRGTALPIDTGGRARHLREQELEADCFAAQVAASPTASLAAGRFFARQGPVATTRSILLAVSARRPSWDVCASPPKRNPRHLQASHASPVEGFQLSP